MRLFQRFQLTSGFTLAELLIAIGILGVIATYSIPKVIFAQQNQKSNAITKEMIATISGIYQAYKYEKGALPVNTPSGQFSVLLPYINYTRILSSLETLDDTNLDSGNPSCSAGVCTCFGGDEICLKFANDAVLVAPTASFNATSATSGLTFVLDPDGQNTGRRDSVQFFLYYNGRITTRAGITASTMGGGGYGPYNPQASDPSWLKW